MVPNDHPLTAAVWASEKWLTSTLGVFLSKTSSTKEVIVLNGMRMISGGYQLEGRLPSQVFMALTTGITRHRG